VVPYKKIKTNKVEVVCFAGEMIFLGNNKTATMVASHTIILLKAPKENTLFSSGLSCKRSHHQHSKVVASTMVATISAAATKKKKMKKLFISL
jgi:hypothetical protein